MQILFKGYQTTYPISQTQTSLNKLGLASANKDLFTKQITPSLKFGLHDKFSDITTTHALAYILSDYGRTYPLEADRDINRTLVQHLDAQAKKIASSKYRQSLIERFMQGGTLKIVEPGNGGSMAYLPLYDFYRQQLAFYLGLPVLPKLEILLTEPTPAFREVAKATIVRKSEDRRVYTDAIRSIWNKYFAMTRKHVQEELSQDYPQKTLLQFLQDPSVEIKVSKKSLQQLTDRTDLSLHAFSIGSMSNTRNGLVNEAVKAHSISDHTIILGMDQTFNWPVGVDRIDNALIDDIPTGYSQHYAPEIAKLIREIKTELQTSERKTGVPATLTLPANGDSCNGSTLSKLLLQKMIKAEHSTIGGVVREEDHGMFMLTC